jgi:hypothetical protein
MSLLARLDRQVESAPDADVKAARLVAQEFDAYLDLVTRDEGPARAGLFLARRSGSLTDDEENPADLAPIYALAAADRLVRTGVATAAEVPVDDLDPAARAEWTAEQWTRAEAAGLLRLAIPEPAPEPQLPQHSPAGTAADAGDEEEDDDGTVAPAALFGTGAFVWWDEARDEWRTRFPPPHGFDGDEDGIPECADYTRTLSAAEAAAMGPDPGHYDDVALAALAQGRTLFFAQAAQERAAVHLRPVSWNADSLFAGEPPI